MRRIPPYRALAALTLAGFMLVAAGGEIASRAHAAKKLPPIAEPMYLSAFASVITGRPDDAIRPLSRLATVDPTMADVHNALALALFAAAPGNHRLAFAHAEQAVALVPGVPQFVVTHVLTDRRQWRIGADGTARLTRAAVLRLRAASDVLLTMRSSARELGMILARLEETGEDADYPFVLPGYSALAANPRLAFTRPSGKSFALAQKAIAENVTAIRNRRNAEDQARRVAAVTDRLIVVEAAESPDIAELQLAEFETAAGRDGAAIDAGWAVESRQFDRTFHDK